MSVERSAERGAPGRVVRVNGPLVEVEGLDGVAMSEVVALGPARLLGELVAFSGEVATVQAYEYTGGLRPGDVAAPRGEPLSAPLGPGLLGGVFDGLLRPLADAGTWLADAVGDAIGVILLSHGAIVIGESVEEAAYRSVTFERMCRLTADALVADQPTFEIAPEHRKGLRDAFRTHALDAYWNGALRQVLQQDPAVLR